jgi:hypothetical protein
MKLGGERWGAPAVEGCHGIRARDCAGVKEVVERSEVEAEVFDFADAARRII